MLTHVRRSEGQTNECKLRKYGILATQTHGLKQLQNSLQLEMSRVPRISRSSVVGFFPPPWRIQKSGFLFQLPHFGDVCSQILEISCTASRCQ